MSEPFDDPKLLELLAAALQEIDEGAQPDLEQLCSGRPDLIDPLSQLIQVGERLPELQRSTGYFGPAVGTLLNERYSLGAKLGAGAMGVVYEATDTELGRRVAVKVLHAPLLDGEEAEARFTREAEALASVRHPAVVAVHDRGQSADGPFLVLELLEGVPLVELVEELTGAALDPIALGADALAPRFAPGALQPTSYLRTVVGWAAELTDGLSAVHAQGIFHRDIKPSNIFLRANGTPTLLDFGIATSTAHATLTLDGSAVGTPAYMAPEALASNREPSAALDVYGLTATLYHLVTLRAPYTGTPSQILSALSAKEPARAGSLHSGLHRDLQAILERGMARDPRERYASAQELGEDLRAFLEHRPVRARRTTALGRTWKRLRRSQTARGAAAVISVALLVFAGMELRDHRAASQQRAFMDAWRALPGSLSLGIENLRRYGNPDLQREIRARLDEAVEADSSSVEARMTRAAFAWDHDDPHRAALDLERVATVVATPYTRALAGAYASAAASGASELDLSALPEPDTALDTFVWAFQARRADPFADVRALAGIEELATHAPSQELLLQHDLFGGDFPGALERATQVERLRGERTAASAGWLGLGMMLSKQYPQSLAVLEEGLALCPNDHGIAINAGRVLWALGRYGEAETRLRHAIAIKPERLATHEMLTRVQLDAGEFDRAYETLSSAPFPADGTGAGQRLSLAGEIEAERALAVWGAGDSTGAKEIAKEAGRLFEEAAKHGGPVKIARAEIARAVSANALEGVCAGILELLVKEPLNPRRVAILLNWIPADLNPEESALVRRFLEAQQRELAGAAGSLAPLTSQ